MVDRLETAWPYGFKVEMTEDATRLVDMSEGLLELYGYDRDELTGPELWRILVPEDIDLVEEVLLQLHEGVGWDGRVRTKNKNGHNIIVEVTVEVESQNQERIVVAGRARDVTDQVELETKLREREARLQVLNERMKLVMWSCDLGLRFTWTWGSGLADRGEEENEHVGRSLYEYFGTDDPQATPIDANIRALAGEHVAFEMEWMGRSYRSFVEPLMGPEGKISGTIGVAIDVTAERSIENETKQIGRELVGSRLAGEAAWKKDEDEIIAAGDIWIDVDAFEVQRNGRQIDLTPTEFRLLVELARRPGRVVTRDALLGRVWGHDFLGGGSLITMAIKRLRSKIEADPSHPEVIETVRGIGYRLKAPVGEAHPGNR